MGQKIVNKNQVNTIIFLDKCLSWANLQQEQCLDTVWCFPFSITQSDWKLSPTQEEYLCLCYWIMNFKQISNTFPLKKQTVYFQFPKKLTVCSSLCSSCLLLRGPGLSVTDNNLEHSHTHKCSYFTFLKVKFRFNVLLIWKWLEYFQLYRCCWEVSCTVASCHQGSAVHRKELTVELNLYQVWVCKKKKN